MSITFEPKNGYLVVKPDTIKVNGGDTGFAIQTSDTDEKASIGTIVQTGGALVVMGDKVIYHKYPAIKQVVGSEEFYLVKEADIISVIRD